MSCKHHKGGRCTNPVALPLYGDNPSRGVCRICPHHAGMPRGLGDIVHTVAKWTGLAKLAPKDCKCAERRQRLNAATPARAALAQKPRGCGCGPKNVAN